MITIYFIYVSIFACLFGIFEAFLFSSQISGQHVSKKWQTIFNFDIHIFFTVLRFMSFVSPIWSVYTTIDWRNAILYSMITVLIFPFFHDGSYYEMRKRIDGSYPNGWIDKSITTTAKNSYGIGVRVFLLTIGVLLSLLTTII